MDFGLTDDQSDIQRTAREMLADRAKPERVREHAEAGRTDDDLWKELAGGALDVALVVGEAEVHGYAAAFNRGRPSTRSATMFLRISVVPPSIELPRARSSS